MVSPLPTTRTEPGSVLTCWINSFTLGRDHNEAGAIEGVPLAFKNSKHQVLLKTF